MEALGLIVRPGREADANFIYHSWLRSYRKSPTTVRISDDVYYTQHHKLVEDILNNPLTRIHVAVPSSMGETDTICAYAVVESIAGAHKACIVHYVYVKETFRNLGLARALMQAAGADPKQGTMVLATHQTVHAEHAMQRHGVVFNPYLLRTAPAQPAQTLKEIE